MRFIPHHGFVLLIVLIFLQIFSLMGVAAFLNAKMGFKIAREFEQKNTFFSSSKYILRLLAAKMTVDKIHCLIEIIPATEMATKPPFWWKQFSCGGQLSEIHYYYVVESLGQDPCAIIENSANNQKLIADYYRITLLSLSNKMKSVRILLQSTIAKASPSSLSCTNNLHRVTIGQQMWREIF